MIDQDNEIQQQVQDIRQGWVIQDWIDPRYTGFRDNGWDAVVGFVLNYWRDRETMLPFTEHGTRHCTEVERNIQRVVRSFGIRLNREERFILSAASYLHDISLCADSEQYEEDVFKLYDSHHERSASWLMDNFRKLRLEESFASSVSEIIKYHRRKEPLKDCSAKSVAGETYVRPRLLAAILRLGDALHVDVSRVSDKYWAYMVYRANIPFETRFHWTKSFLVPAIAINSVDKTIEMQLNIPERLYDNASKSDTGVKRVELLANSITQFLQEELDSVNPILSRYSRYVATTAKYILCKIPDLRPQRLEMLRRFIFDYSGMFSPSASMVIETAMFSIVEGTSEFDDNSAHMGGKYESILRKLMASTQSFISEFLLERPCHIGLRNMWGIVQCVGEAVLSSPRIKEQGVAYHAGKGISRVARTLFTDRLSAGRDAIGDAFVEKLGRSASGDSGKGLTFVLYGNSSTIAHSLAMLDRDSIENTKLYVCECRGKTKYASNNRLVYSDGFYYALNLREQGFGNILIIPDAALAEILSSKDERVDGVLIGANGIGIAGECAHTIGHLMVAKLCRAFEIPLYLISDTFKIGKLVHHPEKQRRGWYTSDISVRGELDAHRIEEWCPREDVISLTDVDYLITEQGVLSGTGISIEDIQRALTEWSTDNIERICRVIERDDDLGRAVSADEMLTLTEKIKGVPFSDAPMKHEYEIA